MTVATDPDRSRGSGLVRQSAITGIVAIAGVASGFALDLAWWHRLGLGDATDAVALALRLPVALAAVVVVLGSQVLVPTFTTWSATRTRAEDARATAGVLVCFVAAAAALALLIVLGARPLMYLLSPDWSAAKLDAAAALTRVLAAYVPCLAAAEVFRSWLTARLVIGPPAMMSLLLNVTGLPIVVWGPAQITTVGIAYLAGALVQVLAMAAIARHHGWTPARPSLRDPAVRHTLALAVRPGVGAGMNPLMRLIEGIVVSFLPVGSATFIHYGNRLTSALGGTVVFRSVMVALVPRLAGAAAAGDVRSLADLTRRGVRLLSYLSVPMTTLGVVLAPAVTTLVFGLGGAAGSSRLGWLMAIYALSFAGSGLQRALLAPFYALRDTRTPLRNTAYGLIANAGLLLGLYPLAAGSPDAIAVVPAAYTIAQYVNVVHAWWRVRRLPGLAATGSARAVAGSLLPGLLGAGTAWLVLWTGGRPHQGVVVVLACVAGVGVSAGLGLLALRRSPARWAISDDP